MSKKLSLIRLAEFTHASDARKRAIVREAQTSAYAPYRDPYKILREGIVRMYKNEMGLDYLDSVVEAAPSSRRQLLRAMADGYRTWAESCDATHFPAIAGTWQCGDIAVPVHPTVGLCVSGERQLVKLYLSNSALSAPTAAMACEIMAQAFTTCHGCIMATSVLDVRRGVLFVARESERMLALELGRAAEEAEQLWDEIQRQAS